MTHPPTATLAAPLAALATASDRVTALSEDCLRQTERYFGESFADVRIHVGAGPSRFGCDAVAAGRRLYFAPGRYAPNTLAGRFLLFHELTHLVQQRRGTILTNAPGLWLVRDPHLEAEADFLAQLASTCSVSPLAASASPTVPCGGWIAQPVVTVTIEGRKIKYQSVWSGPNAEALWRRVEPFGKTAKIDKPTMDRMKKKLADWVNASAKALLWGCKGYDKDFGSVEDVYLALLGRARSRDNRDLERRLANRVNNSAEIKRVLSSFIKDCLRPNHATWMKETSKHAVLVRVPGGRYAPFYSNVTLIAGIISSSAKSLNEAVTYMCGAGREGRDICETASFLADYAMKARDWCLNDAGEKVASDDVTPMPERDARGGHHNVNEQSDWVKRARLANVRLGAGPSATTKLVLAMARWMMAGKVSDTDAQTVMCYISLALFAFWNLKREWLMTTSEIHTYHEVMVVANSMGVPLVRSMDASRVDVAEFEYPDPKDIPG